MPKQPKSTPQQPLFHLGHLKDGRWAVFDRQQRMHGGTHTNKADAEAVLRQKLGVIKTPDLKEESDNQP